MLGVDLQGEDLACPAALPSLAVIEVMERNIQMDQTWQRKVMTWRMGV